MSVKITEAQEHIAQFLKENGSGVLATVSSDGEPHAATIYLAYDGEFNAYFLTKTETQKHKNLHDNKKAAIAVYEPSSQTTVQMKGTVTEVTDTEQRDEVFGKILKIAMDSSESGIPPISKLKAGEYVVYKLDSSSVHMASFIRPDSGTFEQIFEIA